MAYTSQSCPRCWTPYRSGAKRCLRCGFDLGQEEGLSFIDLFGPPEVLRRYQIQDTLAHSQVGHVYRALDLETRTPCVVKELSGAALLDPLEAELAAGRLQRRVRQLGRLSHPNLVRVHGLVSEGSRHFVIMDWVQGPTLEKVLQGRERPVPEHIALQWAGQLCDALGHLHDQDPPLLFPDLTAQHVILSSESQPVLVDLGLTHLFQQQHTEGEATAGDVAALGALLYQALTLRSPRQGRHPPIQQLNPDISTSSAQAIGRAMRRQSQERFASMAQFREALLTRAPLPGRPATVIPLIAPYELVPGRQARTLQELVEAILCGGPEEWEAGLAQFLAGSLTAWLHDVAARMQEAGQDGGAREISAASEAGEKLRQEAQQASAVQQQAALFEWLTATGYAWGQPQLAVGTLHLRLGAVKGELRMGAIFNIQNKGTGFLVGEVKSEVEWLTVREGEFGCRSGEAAQITVELRDHSTLSRPVSWAQALRITSNGGQAWVGASLAAPRPLLALYQDVVDFGEVRSGERAHSRVVIRNGGGGVLTGSISSRVPWLRVQPSHFRCAAGTAAPVDVELRTDLLPLGTTIQASALIVDSDHGQARIEVRGHRVQPQLRLAPEVMDFGAIAPVYRISQTLRVTNEGSGLLEGTVVSHVDWLTVEQLDFRCRSRETALISVWADPTALPGGQTEAPEALIVDSNGGYVALAVHLTVRRPRLQVDPRPLDFGTLVPGQERLLALRVGNEGVTPLHVELVPRMPWLAVEPDQIVCAGGEQAEVRVTLRVPPGAQAGPLQADRALYVASDGGVTNLDVQAEIVSPHLTVDPLHLDFGLIGPSDVVRGRLRLQNEGSGTLEWHLGGEFTWLEVFPRQGSCSSGEEAIIEVNGFALGLAEGTTSAHALLRVESNAGQLEIPISVAIAAPTLTVLPLLLDLGRSENYVPIEGTLRVVNHGGGDLRGEVAPRVPWLSTEPATFHCAAGSVAEIRVLADPRDLPEGETVVPEALVLNSNGGREIVDIRLELVLRPILQATPPVLTFRIGRTQAETASAEGLSVVQTLTLTLTNQGYGALRVRLQPTVKWLTTDRGSSTLRHERRARIQVSLDALAWRESGQEAHLEIRAGENTLASIPITVIAESDSEKLRSGLPHCGF